MKARVIQVIEVNTTRGTGTQKDPVREITQYWALDGKLLAERDEHLIVNCMKYSDQEVKEFYAKNFRVAPSPDDMRIGNL